VEPVTAIQLAKLALSIADKALKIPQTSGQARLAVALDEANKKLDALVSAPLREAIYYFNAKEYDKSRSRAITAISIDEMSAVGHLILALSDLAKEANNEEGLTALVTAVRLNPFLLPDRVWEMDATRGLASLGLPKPERPGTTIPFEPNDAQLLAQVNGPVKPRWLLSIGYEGFVPKGLYYGKDIAFKKFLGSNQAISYAGLAVDPIKPDLQFLAIQLRNNRLGSFKRLGVLNAKSGELLWADSSFKYDGKILMAAPAAVVTVAQTRVGWRVQLRDPSNGRILRTYAPTVFEDIYFPRLWEYDSYGRLKWHIPQYCSASYARSNLFAPNFTSEEIHGQVVSGAARLVQERGAWYRVSRTWQMMDPYGRGLANIAISNECLLSQNPGSMTPTATYSTPNSWATVRSL
jgi:hypothetical protein